MKNTSNIIKDLLVIIERQEREIKSSAKNLSMNQLVIEKLKSELRETKQTNNLLENLAKELSSSGEKYAALINTKKDNRGNNSFSAGNN